MGLGGCPGCPKCLLDDFWGSLCKICPPIFGSFWDMIFACFLGSPSGGHFLIFCGQEAPKLELFGSHLGAFFENLKTVISETPHTLQACGEGPKWYLFGYFFGGCFRGVFGAAFFTNLVILGGPLGDDVSRKKRV